jgi:hypothetical protein
MCSVGRRTAGGAGANLLTGQHGDAPVEGSFVGGANMRNRIYTFSGCGVPGRGMAQISSPNASVLVLGRALIYSDRDLPTAYDLSKQIQLSPLGRWQPEP